MFADGASKAALLESLAEWRRQTEEQIAVGRKFMAEHVAGTAPYPERANLNTLWWVLSAEQLRVTVEWIDFAEREVRRWDDTRPRPFDRRSRRHAERLVAGEPFLVPPD